MPGSDPQRKAQSADAFEHVNEAVRIDRIVRDSRRGLSVNLAAGIEHSRRLASFAGTLRRR